MKPSKIIQMFLFLPVIFIFSGCASYSLSNTGEKFYSEDIPDKSKNNVRNWLKTGVGHLIKDDVVGRFGLPAKERIMYKPNFLVLGWAYGETRSKSLDLGVYKYSGQVSQQYMLSVVFNEDGYLDNFEIELVREPSSANAFTTKLIVDVAIYYFHIQQLENLMTRALNRSVDRFYNRVSSDLNNVGENINTDEIKIKIEEWKGEVQEN
jgi:hypothetical protein